MPLNTLKNLKTSPLISFIIPTLNSASVLEFCLASIKKQSLNSYEILIVDGASSDSTLKIAHKFNTRIIKNPLKTAESAKALGLKNSHGLFVAFVDSDNILPSKNWLSKMLLPFNDPEIIGTEPIAFTYRKNAGFLERYSALIGANDPFAFFNGNYDRFSQITQKWTSLNLKTQEYKNYLKVCLDDNRNIPTIGANGTIFRKNFLNNFIKGNYLFDIDILSSAPKPLYFAKVKIGIIHTFCESSILKFIRKQNRRLTDYYTYKSLRRYQWSSSKRIFTFTFYSLLLIPSIFDSFKGFFRKPDLVWFFHPIACYLTWWIYFIVTLKFKLKLLKPLNRYQWRQ